MRTARRLVALTLLILSDHPRTPGTVESWLQAPATDPALEQQLAALVPQRSPVITPRPASVGGVATPVLSLNGTWQFSPAEGVAPGPIEVPGEWAMQGFDVPKDRFATYRRSVDVPADWRGMTVKLRFDAVHAECEVLVNGRAVGGHEGGMVPFELDVTSAIRPGRNDVAVRVRSESIADTIACLSQYAAHQVGGILRTVTLFCVPSAHIARLWYETTVAGGDARLVAHTEVEGNGGTTARAPAVSHRLLDPTGRAVAAGDGSSPMDVRAARLWTSETPALYTLETTLSLGGRPLQTLRLRIGLREIRVAGTRLLVNGRPVKLLGINRHEVHPLRGRSLTPELNRRDAELFRAANVNLVRTSHYPPSEEFLDACDQLGIFVESEAAVCWVMHGASPIWKTWSHLDPKFFPYLLRATLDNIAAHRNHPSVLMWSLGNESMWTPLFARVLEIAKTDDPTRPFTFHDQSWGGYNNAGSRADIANFHYPSEDPAEWDKALRPMWFGEYAHLQCYNRRELATDPWIREDWGRPLARMVDLMWQHPGVLGGAIWSGVDDVFHMPNGDLKGYGHWGPIDGWRRQKPEWLGVKNAYTPFRLLKTDSAPGRPVVLTVQNRFNFTDLADTRIAWQLNGRPMGALAAGLAPHATGSVTVPAAAAKAGDRLAITVTDRRGVEVAREVITIPAPTMAGDADQPAPAAGGNPLAAWVSAVESITGPGEASSLLRPLPLVLALNREGGTSTAAGTQLANVIEPFTPLPPAAVVSAPEPGAADVGFPVSGPDYTGRISVRPGARAGQFEVSYRLDMKTEINPRQWGLVFTLPRAFDTITWARDAQWSWYPDDHTGRPAGTARANPVSRVVVEEPRVPMTGPWSLDATALGTNDFRSTKARIRDVRLTTGDGRIWRVVSPDASQSVRAWIDGDRVRVLVAGFNTGGFDQFFNTHYSEERRPLKPGAALSSSFRLEMTGK